MSAWDPRLARAVLFAERHLEEPGVDLSIEALARRAHLSPYHFHRTFRAALGEPVSAWVRRLRLERAAMLLRHTERPISDVARACGYATQAAFTRAFTRQHQRAPGSWRSTNALTLWAPREHVPDRLPVTRLPELRLLWRRHTGDWTGLSELLRQLCDRFDAAGWYRSDTQLALLLYDEPDVTAPERQRADLGLTLPADAEVQGWDVRTPPACRAAYQDVAGDYATFEAAAVDFRYRLFPASGLRAGTAYQLALGAGRLAWDLADDLDAALAGALPARVLQPLA